MKREMHIPAMLACLLVAACMAIMGNHRNVIATDAVPVADAASVQKPCRECITAMPTADAVGIECMPQISVPHTAVGRTGRVQQFRSGSSGGFAGSNCRNVSVTRRTASGSLHIFGTSSPVCCNFIKNYYIYMLRRIVI